MSINGKLSAFTMRSHAKRVGMVFTSTVFASLVGLGFAAYFRYDAKLSPGWHTAEDGTYYIVRSTRERAVGLKQIDSASYLFDDKGIMQTGWQTYDGYTYYFDKSGVMLKGVVEIDGEEYYLSDESGIFKVGLHDFNGDEYYFNDHGFPDIGFNTDGDYYYDDTGKRITGLCEINGIKYYFFESGEHEGETERTQEATFEATKKRPLLS